MSIRRLFQTLLMLVITVQAASLPAVCCTSNASAHCAVIVKKCCAVKPMPCCQVRQGNCNTRPQPQEDSLNSIDQLSHLSHQLSATDLVVGATVLDVSNKELMRLATATRIALKAEKYKPDRLYILNCALLM